VADDVVDPATADVLRRHVRAGNSVVVAAGPSRVGKSTLADALAGELPHETGRVYVRGGYETFDFAGEIDVGRTALLVNEISPHRPSTCGDRRPDAHFGWPERALR
jgi:energy-coupling factor transporter ATP-binding protein EcfA2